MHLDTRLKEGRAARMAARPAVTHYRLSRKEYQNTVYDLLNGHARGQSPGPDFRAGAQVNAVLDAVAQAAQSQRWEAVPQSLHRCR